MEHKIINKTEEVLNQLLDEGLNQNNIELVYKLTKTRHIAKEDECMNYNGRTPGYNSYGRYYGNYGENYGRRGYDMKYRGDESLDRMYGEYGRYMENRNYGAGEETDKSFHYMVKALEDFIKVLHEEATNESQRQMLRETLQRSMM